MDNRNPSVKRSLSQNDKLHSICRALVGKEWAGKPRSLDEWKALLISGHAAVERKPFELIEGLEGELVAIRESSARMSKERAASLITYAESFCIVNGYNIEE